MTETETTVQKLSNQLAGGKVTFDEYAYNITLRMATASENNLISCVDMIPTSILPRYAAYLRDFLEPFDFMPCPTPFLAGAFSEEIIEAKKRSLRPRYIRLSEVVREKNNA